MNNNQTLKQTQQNSTAATNTSAAKSNRPTPEVLEIGKINFVGNVIPHTWFQALTFKDGKPNLPAIVVLSEICYWYRPRVVKDERTGAVISTEKRFASDKLQRSYSSFSTFGLTKDQAYKACHFLRDKGLITLEPRTITMSGGQKISNVLFIGILPQAIAEISSPHNLVVDSDDTPSSTDDTPSSTDDTYTEITTETTTKITKEKTFGSDAAGAKAENKKEKTQAPKEISAKIYAICKLVPEDCTAATRKHVHNAGAWLVKKYPEESVENLCEALELFALWHSTVRWKGRQPEPHWIPQYWQQAVDYAVAEVAEQSQTQTQPHQAEARVELRREKYLDEPRCRECNGKKMVYGDPARPERGWKVCEACKPSPAVESPPVTKSTFSFVANLGNGKQGARKTFPATSRSESLCQRTTTF